MMPDRHGDAATEHSPLLAAPRSTPSSRSSPPPDEARTTLSRARLLACTLGLGLLVFLQTVNVSVLTTTQSAIAADLDAFARATWLTAAYLIPSAALAPLAGKLAAVFSPRAIIAAAAILLAVGAAVCAAAHSFEVFTLGRVLGGVGSAGVIAVSTIIVLEIAPPQRRGLAIGLQNSCFTAGVSLGAVIGGALLAPLGWRAVFALQGPLLVVGAAALLWGMPTTFTRYGTKQDVGGDETAGESNWARAAQIDYLGALTLCGAIVLMLFALSAAMTVPLLPMVLAGVVAVAFVLNEIYLARDPILPLALLRSRGLFCTCLATVGFMMSRWTVLFFAPTYAIAVRGWAPALAGSILIPTNIGFAAGGVLAGALHIRRSGSFYWASLACYVIAPVTLGLLALSATRTAPAAAVVAIVVANGLATGAALNYTLAHLLHLIPPETAYVATSFLATFRGFSGSFGSAAGGGLFSRTLHDTLRRLFAEQGLHRSELVRRLVGSPALVGSLTGIEREVAVQGYEESLRVLWLAAAGLAALMILIQAAAGWQGHAQRQKAIGDEESVDDDSVADVPAARV